MARIRKRILDMRSRITVYLVLLSTIPALTVAIFMAVKLANLKGPRQLPFSEILQMVLVTLGVLIVCGLISLLLGFLIARSLSKPLSRLEDAIKMISEGNLNLQVKSESEDEIGHLYNNFEKMIDVLNDILADIYDSTNSIIYFKDNIDEVITTFNSSIGEQQESVDKSKEVFKELSSSVKSVEKSVHTSLKVTAKAQDEVKNANQRIAELVQEMDNISGTSREISRVTEIINGIAEKTRLLSLNAAIEAKRSGEAGRGFAVVSTEIRKLAAQSNQAVNEIDILIKRNDKIIRSGVNKTTEMKDTLKAISESFQMIIQIINMISEAASKEGKSTLGIMDIIGTFSDITMKNSKFSESLENLKEKLSKEVDKIRNLIFTFKTDVSTRKVFNDIKVKTNEERVRKQKMKKAEKIKKQKEKNKQRQAKTDKEISSAEDLAEFKPKKKLFNFSFGKEKSEKGSPVQAQKQVKQKKVKIPEKMNKGQFTAKIGSKIEQEEDLAFVKTLYDFDEFEEIYFLKEDLSEQDSQKLKDILIQIGY